MRDVEAVVFDVGRVLIQWELRALFEKLIDDPAELDWFLANVVTEEWHFQHDAGRPLGEMVPERQAEFAEHAALIEAYATRFLETIPGRVPGTAALVERLTARGMPLYAITNFGAEFWAMFRPTEPVLDAAGSNLLWAELCWACTHEDVRHLDDLLLRRTRLGLTVPDGASGGFLHA